MSNRKRNVEFLKPEEPDFIKKLKARAGLTEGPDIETKKETLPKTDIKDLEDRDEEQPVVVVLKSGDMTEEEVKQYKDIIKTKEEETDLKNNKIVFRKPDKKQSEDKKNNLIQSSSNKYKEESNLKQKIESNDRKSVQNSNLLSFGDEEEDEDYSN